MSEVVVLPGITYETQHEALKARVTALETTSGGTRTGADLNTLVPGDVSAREWRTLLPAQAVKIKPNHAAADSPYLDAHHINYLGDAPADGAVACPFVAPTGVTAVTFDVPAALPSGVGASTIAIKIIRTSDGVVMATLNQVLTAALTTYSLAATLAAGIEYMAIIYVGGQGSNAQAQALIGRVKIRITAGAIGVFAAAFERINLEPWMFEGNSYQAEYRTGRYWFVSSWARLGLETDAQNIVVEGVASVVNGSGSFGALVNGRPVTSPGSFATTGRLTQVAWSSIGAGLKRLDLLSPSQANSAGGFAAVGGGWFRALYVPLLGTSRIARRNKALRILILGDSITQSNGAYKSWTNLVRAALPNAEIIIDGWGGRQLAEDTMSNLALYSNTDPDSTKVKAMARRLAQHKPDIIWDALGTNDYGGNPWNVTRYASALGILYDELHVLLPALRIYAQTMTNRGNEAGTNPYGNTIVDYRTQKTAVATARAAYCVVADGTQAFLLTDTTDNLHPNEIGSSKYAAWVLGVLNL